MIGTIDVSEVAVLIVGYKNADDIGRCLTALSSADTKPRFDIFICENGGVAAYDDLIRHLVDESGCCAATAAPYEPTPAPFLAVRRLTLVSRSTRVVVGCAPDNLGYGGGVNAWLRQLLGWSGWSAVWILNPDTEPTPEALGALVARAQVGDKGMVGSTILEAGSVDVVRFRGGLHWQKHFGRSLAIGLGEPVHAPVDVGAIELAMDSPSGASMYVTRRCIEHIGLMDESYFLFFEDLDWGVRAKQCGIGYASDSIVAHKRGTTTGSAGPLASQSALAVYLEQRNGILFVRRHYPRWLPVRIAASMLFSARFLLSRAPRHFLTSVKGIFAGLRGETGIPSWIRSSS